jgi:O-glycosyl hydrolase
MRTIFPAALVLCLAQAGFAAEGAPGDLLARMPAAASWPANPGYQVSQAGGVATLHVNKQVMWAGQQLLLAAPMDLADRRFLDIEVRTSAPMVLDLYLLDGKAAVNLPHRIRAVGAFQDYCYDFSAIKSIDTHHITGFIFCVNGAATGWAGTVELRHFLIGDQAQLLPDIEAVEDQEWYHDTGAHAALLTGLAHVHELSLAGAEKLLRHVSFSAIADGRSLMSYELIPGASGSVQATLSAVGEGGYGTLARSFTVLVEDNLPPTIDAHEPVTALAGRPLTVRFSGVSDGNFTADQPLAIAVASSNPAVLATADIQASNPHGGPYLELVGTPKAPGDTVVTVTLDDQSGGRSTTSTAVKIHAVARWNNAPTLDPVAGVTGFVSEADQQVALTGIGDGDQGSQTLTCSAASSNALIVPDPTVTYLGGDRATLHFSPTATPGVATITVRIADHGGAEDNNGDQSIARSFVITTRKRPAEAFAPDLADYAALKPRLRAEDGISVAPGTDGPSPVITISCKDKSTYGGLWLAVPDLDLSDAAYLSVDVKCDQRIAFNMYFYDGSFQRNDGAKQATVIGGRGSDWRTVTFDFSAKGQMANDKSAPINAKWVTTVLFNFHPNFNWPFSNWTGTLQFRNLRIGKAADIPKRNPAISMDAVPAQVAPQGSGALHLSISGLGVANGAPIALSASETGTTAVLPTLGAIEHGAATLTLTAGKPGRSAVTINATAPNADPATITFTVDVVDPSHRGAVEIAAGTTFQTIRGFGTFFGPDVDLYTARLGASALRIGDDCDFNPRKDTSDLGVLNRARLNYKAFDFDYFRRMKAAGVETFFFTAWSPPAWQKANFSTNFQGDAAFGDSDQCLNRLDYSCYEDYAKTLVALVRMFQEEAGITLDAISLQNEPSFCEPYGSAILDPTRMVRLVDVVGRRFAKEGIPTRFLMPEQVFTQGNMLDYIRVLNADPEAQGYCSIIATHGYDEKGVAAASPDFPAWTAMFNLAQRGTGPKELWMSETYPAYTNWSSAMNYSMSLYGSLEYGNISLWTQWSIEGTLLDRNLPTDSFWVVRQYWKYIRPGAKRVATTCKEPGVFATSYLNDARHGGKLVSVLTNHNPSPAILSLSTSNKSEVASWEVVTTDPVRHGAEMGVVKSGEALLLPPSSVTTVVEQ